MELYDELKLGEIRMNRKVFGHNKEEVHAIHKLVFAKPKPSKLENKSVTFQRKSFQDKN